MTDDQPTNQETLDQLDRLAATLDKQAAKIPSPGDIRTMTLEQMDEWLFTDKGKAWRSSSDALHVIQQGQMLDRYYELPDDPKYRKKSFRSKMDAQLRDEQIKADQIREATKTAEARADRLRQVALKEWLEMGASEAEFNRQWESYRVELIKTGRAEALLEKEHEAKRRKAARISW